MTAMTVLAHHLDDSTTTYDVDITPEVAPDIACDVCTGSLLNGVLLYDSVPAGGVIGPFERCDGCARFAGDLEAAAAVAFIVGGVAHFEAACGRDDDHNAIPGHPHDDCREMICTGTDPWVTITSA